MNGVFKVGVLHLVSQTVHPRMYVEVLLSTAHLVQLVHEAHDVRDHPVGTLDEPEGGREDGGERDAAVPEDEGRVVGDVLPAGAVVVPGH